MTSSAAGAWSKKALVLFLGILRLFLVLAATSFIVVELIEAFLNKEVMHLALFATFFLICSFQVNLSRHKDVMKSEERTGRLFVLALFSLSAAFLELVDLGLDQLLGQFKASPALLAYYQSLSLFETFLGIAAIVLVAYSLDRMLVSLRSIAADYRSVSL